MANKLTRKRVTVYIGRFQPLHLGHTHVLGSAFESSDAVIVLVGSSYQARTIKNPFTFDERKAMLLNWMDSNPICSKTPARVLPLRDQPYNDAKWMQSVQEQVKAALDSMVEHCDGDLWDAEIVLTGSERDASTWYLAAFPQWKTDFKAPVPVGQDLNATTLRDKLFTEDFFVTDWRDLPHTTYRFLQQFIESPILPGLKAEYAFIKRYKEAWAAAPYAPTFLTADAIIIQSGHVLVVERANFPGKGLWALPGGFLNQNERLKDCAIRETMEETGILLAEGKKAVQITRDILKGSIIDYENFDNPGRSLRGRTVTVGFLFRLDDTKPLPFVTGQNMPLEETGGKIVVETAKAIWLPISEALAKSENWFEDHHSLVDWGVSAANAAR